MLSLAPRPSPKNVASALGVHPKWVLTSVLHFSFLPSYCRILRLLMEELCCFSMKSHMIVSKGRQSRCSPALWAHSYSAYNTVLLTGINLYPNAQQRLYPPHSWGTLLLSPSSALSLALFCILNVTLDIIPFVNCFQWPGLPMTLVSCPKMCMNFF